MGRTSVAQPRLLLVVIARFGARLKSPKGLDPRNSRRFPSARDDDAPKRDRFTGRTVKRVEARARRDARVRSRGRGVPART